jgi:Domain of unknown function (DUF4395)
MAFIGSADLNNLNRIFMRHSILPFGETIPGYSVPILNERAIRAGAGILFFFAMVTFMNAWLLGNFAPTRVFIVAFLIDFSIRLFISPKYAPSLIAGQWLVRKQAPEYTGAAQKAFAWAIGFELSSVMFFMMVVNQMVSPINMLVCATCLILMWFETSAGICIGCKMYNFFAKDPAQLCPGDTCTYTPKAGAGGNWMQGLTAASFLMVIVLTGNHLLGNDDSNTGRASMHTVQTETPLASLPSQAAEKTRTPPIPAPTSEPSAKLTVNTQAKSDKDAAEIARCTVPEFAKKIGHEAMWKKHNNCN